MTKIKLFETFAGVGSQSMALRNLGVDYTSDGYVEWYIPAIISYESIHHGLIEKECDITKEEMVSFLNQYSFSSNSKSPVSDKYWSSKSKDRLWDLYKYLKRSVDNGNQVDITRVESLPKDIDIFTYSFPCQDLSQQGNQAGITKSSRSGLLWEVERILKNNTDRLPKYLVLENVKALAGKKFISQFNEWIEALNNLGYNSTWKVLRSSNFGSPQNRDRVFMISSLTSEPKIELSNDKPKITLSSIVEKYSKRKMFIPNKKTSVGDIKITPNNIHKYWISNYSNFNSENWIYGLDGNGPTLTASGSNNNLKLMLKDNVVGYMSPIECWKYMGFDVEDYNTTLQTELVTANQTKFLSGNSISVEVLEYLFDVIIKDLKRDHDV